MRIAIEKYAAWKASDESPKPDVSFMPMMERRRLTGVERAAISVAHKVYPAGEEVPVVFASRWGEIGTTLKLMKQQFADGEVSPAGFSASVHNAAPGALSLFERDHAPYTAIAAAERSLAMGFLEACAMGSRVVFVYAEEATPEDYMADFQDVQTAKGVAVLLAPCEDGIEGEAVPCESFDAFFEFLENVNRWAS